MQSLASSPAGLTQAQASAALRAQPGPRARMPSWLVHLLRIAANPLVVILLVSSGLTFGLGQHLEALIIGGIVLLSSTLDFLQSHRSSRAARKLGESVATTTTVLRDGHPCELPLAQVVPGDVVQLAAGSLVPGDGLLIEGRDVHLNEAALTGESLPAEKEAGQPLFLGTSVLSGTGSALIVHTGAATELGRVAAHLAETGPKTEFERGIAAFGSLILKTVVALVIFVFLANLWFARPPLQALLFSVALAVGLTPEFLPMIISVTLAAAAVRMARARVIVKVLPSIENLGSMDVLASDKTGTLTEGRIVLERYVDPRGQESARVLLLAAVNSALETGLKSPMDDAILAHEHPSVQQYTKLDEVPFDFSRRMVSVVAQGPEDRLLICKGAPESLLDRCHLDPAARLAATATFEGLSRDGFRVLALASRAIESRPAYSAADETGLELDGFVGFLDPPRADAREVVEELRADGVTIKILTGDNELLTGKICREVGIDDTAIQLGRDLEGLDAAALGELAERTTIFARVSPEQKNLIVRALQARGHVVGYLGDGINDAPALRSADVGISVDSAVDVAREAADIILLDKSLRAIHQGILEGRRSFANITKYILMGTSSNFGNMFSMAIASLFLPFLPLLPGQLLLNSFLYDCSQIAIPADRVDAEAVARPRRWDMGMIRHFMVTMGPLSSLYDLLTFAVLLWVFQAGPELFRSGWFIESLATQVLVIFVIRTSGRPWRSRPHPALTLGALGSVTLGLALPYTPVGAWLGLGPLPAAFYGFLGATVVTYLGLVELVKRRFYAS